MMVFQSFILGNLVSLCMKIINSVVVVGLYYGFLTTFSIGPSYLFLLRARVMDEGEEGTEKKVSATTGFIAGQLMMFISIYYAPLHLALGRPHTITVLALPYLLFHFFWNNHKHFFDYGSTTRNEMRNLRIQCVFLNNLIFQLFNHFILPSSMLARLVNIYMFRCNNKMLFVTSSFVGWLIGHILFMKWVGLVLVWIQQNNSIRSNVLIRSNKYKFLVSELRNSMARIFSIILFITCVYYLGRIPSPIFTKKLKGTSETEERGGTKQDQEVSTEEAPFPSLFSEEREDLDKIDEMEEIRVNGKDKINKDDEFHVRTYYNYKTVSENRDGNKENSNLEFLKKKKKEDHFLWFEKPFVTLVFDYKRWNRPNRYIKNDKIENTVRNEMSQYFFYTCQSDGKERISFTYPSNLSTFFEMIKKSIPSFTTEKTPSDQVSTCWSLINEEKKENLKNEFLNRIEALDKEWSIENILEKTTRFCHNETKKEYLPKIYDPFLHGISRGRIKKLSPFQIITKTYKQKNIRGSWINKIHGILLKINSHKFEQTIEKFNRKSLSIDKKLYFVSEHQEEKIHSEEEIKIFKFLFDVVIIDNNDQTLIKNFIDLHEINKKVPRWSYKLTSELEELEGETEENVPTEPGLRSRKAKRVVVFTDKEPHNEIYTNLKDNQNSDQKDEMALIRYSQQSDFRREIIKGSMRSQRRKTVIWEFLQAKAHSPLFFDRIDKLFFFSFDIWGLKKKIIRNLMWKKKKKIAKKEEEQSKIEEKRRIEIAETWDSFLFAQIIRGSLLVTQSILRKYIILPLLIIIKNSIRMLFFQFPEWSEDLKDWKREMHVKCTYNGVQLSETEFPRNWLTDGIQIKILFPFYLKPWHQSKFQSSHKARLKKTKGEKNDFCFLTVWGLETDLPFGSAKTKPYFFEPIFKELKKRIKKSKTTSFLVLKIFKERATIFLKVAKEIKNWIIKNLLFIKGKIKNLSKRNRIPLVGLREIYELNETKKDSIMSNQTIHELSVQKKSMEWTNSSLSENKIKNVIDRIKTIRNQTEEISKEKLTNSCNKPYYDSKIIESSKKSWQTFKRKKTRLIGKSVFFIKFCVEQLSITIFIGIINIPRITTQLFFESTKKILDRYIYKNDENDKKINKKKKTIYFISTIKNLILNKKKISYDLCSLSQAYVFYKLSQIPVSNFYKLKAVFEYNIYITSFFVKNQIKDFFQEQGIFHYESKDKTLLNYEINQWKNWLRSHSQYNLPQIAWARLVTQKWKKKINQDSLVLNPSLTKVDSYDKKFFYNYKKQNFFEANSFLNPKHNLKKDSIYNLFFYKSIYSTEKIFDMSIGIALDNCLVSYFLEKYNIRGIGEIRHRKYLDWRIINFWFRKKVNIEPDTKSKKKYIKTQVQNYQRIDKITKTGLANQKRNFFDWMGMNEEILNHHIKNFDFFFFPEFFLFSSTYKMKPWVIPIKLLLLNFNETKNVNKQITLNKKGFIPSNKKKYLRFYNINKEENESAGQEEFESNKETKRNTESALSNQEKNIEENYAESKIKKRKNKKQPKSNTEAELDLFLKRYSRFQLRWNFFFNQKILNNVKVYCLLVRLKNPNEIAISSIERGEMSLDILMIEKNLTFAKLMKKGILIIEPVRLSVQNDGQLIIYRTIGISLVHKNKHKISKRSKKKSYIDKKNNYDFFVPENILSPKRRREFRILICFNLKKKNARDRNSRFDTNIKNLTTVLHKKKDLDKDQNNLIKFKSFLWPNFRLEDLACMNRYWFNTTNGNHFSMIRIHMYTRFQIH
uniref:Protein TIC 214 n=2 Tax=Sinalliaria limprichtiana var. grandifolia TaxID=2069296 RepID=A0A1U9HYY9_9BRAS|nr:Ycf1 [Sinalliaria limprichtiana var. grandifolia]APM86146.1 Ycf1 [Sinalliaria limprichtiana var. grandifolia]